VRWPRFHASHVAHKAEARLAGSRSRIFENKRGAALGARAELAFQGWGLSNVLFHSGEGYTLLELSCVPVDVGTSRQLAERPTAPRWKTTKGDKHKRKHEQAAQITQEGQGAMRCREHGMALSHQARRARGGQSQPHQSYNQGPHPIFQIHFGPRSLGD
jgi:hypothetical protein